MVMAAGTERANSPWGPFTVTVLSVPTATETPEGTGMGERPMRDISGYLRSSDGRRGCGYQT
jgi:hypothetical protein